MLSDRPRNLLALDPATACGWAVYLLNRTGHYLLDTGTWDLKPQKGEPPGTRWVNLWCELEQINDSWPGLEVVAFEDVPFHGAGFRAAHMWGGLIAVIEGYCAVFGLDLIPAPVAKIKKHATGNGRAKKEEMIQVARQAWPLLFMGSDQPDHNAIDACWIGDWACKQLTAVTETEIKEAA